METSTEKLIRGVYAAIKRSKLSRYKKRLIEDVLNTLRNTAWNLEALQKKHETLQRDRDVLNEWRRDVSVDLFNMVEPSIATDADKTIRSAPQQSPVLDHDTAKRVLLLALRMQIKKLRAPIAMLMWCPECGKRHIDEGVWSQKPHHTHACQHCGMTWRPAEQSTVGVRFIPGYKNTSLMDFADTGDPDSLKNALRHWRAAPAPASGTNWSAAASHAEEKP